MTTVLERKNEKNNKETLRFLLSGTNTKEMMKDILSNEAGDLLIFTELRAPKWAGLALGRVSATESREA